MRWALLRATTPKNKHNVAWSSSNTICGGLYLELSNNVCGGLYFELSNNIYMCGGLYLELSDMAVLCCVHCVQVS